MVNFDVPTSTPYPFCLGVPQGPQPYFKAGAPSYLGIIGRGHNLRLGLYGQVPSLRKQPTLCEPTTGFTCEMKSEKRAQKFHTDEASLPRSGKCLKKPQRSSAKPFSGFPDRLVIQNEERL